MVTGIPGAGIGGLFYLVSAFSLPLRVARRWLRGERDDLRTGDVLRQVLIAAGILGGIWITGWLLGLVVTHGLLERTREAGSLRGLPGATPNVVRVAALLAGFATLGLVILTVEMGRFVFARRTRPAGRARRGDNGVR